MKKHIKLLIIILAACIVAILAWLYLKFDTQTNSVITAPSETKESENNSQKDPASEQESSFDKEQYPLDDPESIWVLVNKRNAIPTSYVPKLTVPGVRLRLSSTEQQMQINPVVEPDLKRMFDAALDDGVNLVFGSGYRSANLQAQFYNSYVASDGQALADTYSARPGHSEHQTGLSVDITSPSGACHLEICWEDTLEGAWVKSNAHKYGFIIRYEEGKDGITGYQYEPWHLRYVGEVLSREIHAQGVTFEEFFNQPAAPDYL